MYVYIYILYIHTYVCMRVHTYTYIHTKRVRQISIHIDTHTYTFCLYSSCVCIVCVCMNIYTHIHICTYVSAGSSSSSSIRSHFGTSILRRGREVLEAPGAAVSSRPSMTDGVKLFILHYVPGRLPEQEGGRSGMTVDVLDVEGFDTIDNIKAKIHQRHQELAPDRFHLLREGVRLNGGDTVGDLRLVYGTLLEVQRQVTLELVQASGASKKSVFQATDTLEFVQACIACSDGIPPAKQRLTIR